MILFLLWKLSLRFIEIDRLVFQAIEYKSSQQSILISRFNNTEIKSLFYLVKIMSYE